MPVQSTDGKLLQYMVTAMVIVGLMSFAAISRQQAHHMAAEWGHGIALTGSAGIVGGVASATVSATSASSQSSAGRGRGTTAGAERSIGGSHGDAHDHFPSLIAQELNRIGASSRDHENALHEKLKTHAKSGSDTGNLKGGVIHTESNLRKSATEGERKTATGAQNIAGESSDNVRDVGEKESEGGRLHTVTYATHGGKDDRFCRAVESAIRNDYDLVILGWGDKWLGLSQKLKAAHAYASALPPNDLILFTDAFDVLYVSSGAQVVEQFSTFHTDIVFSAECGCWPHVMEKGGRPCFVDYPKAPTPYRYLNSGTWIGRAAPAADMLVAVMESAGGDFKNANDQKLVADFYIEGKFGIQLDFYNKLFQSMHMTDSPPLPYCNPMDDISLTNGKYYNKRTKSQPVVFHFNGGGKRHHLQMESKVWYKGAMFNSRDDIVQLRKHLVSAPTASKPKRRLNFEQLCPTYATIM